MLVYYLVSVSTIRISPLMASSGVHKHFTETTTKCHLLIVWVGTVTVSVLSCGQMVYGWFYAGVYLLCYMVWCCRIIFKFVVDAVVGV